MKKNCKICDEPVAAETMTKENQEHLLSLMDVKDTLAKFCMNCIILNRHMQDCNVKALKFFIYTSGKSIKKIEKVQDENNKRF